MTSREPLSPEDVKQAVDSMPFPLGIPEYESWVDRDQVTIGTKYNENWDADITRVFAEVSLDLAVKFSEELNAALPDGHYVETITTGVFGIYPE